MLKTNSKKLNEKVHAYILEEYNGACEGYSLKPTNDYKTACQNIQNIFEKEKPYNRVATRQDFNYWAINSCSFFTDLFWYDDIRKLLANWLEQTKEKANKYSNDKVQTTFLNILYREFQKGLK